MSFLALSIPAPQHLSLAAPQPCSTADSAAFCNPRSNSPHSTEALQHSSTAAQQHSSTVAFWPSQSRPQGALLHDTCVPPSPVTACLSAAAVLLPGLHAYAADATLLLPAATPSLTPVLTLQTAICLPACLPAAATLVAGQRVPAAAAAVLLPAAAAVASAGERGVARSRLPLWLQVSVGPKPSVPQTLKLGRKECSSFRRELGFRV